MNVYMRRTARLYEFEHTPRVPKRDDFFLFIPSIWCGDRCSYRRGAFT